MNILIAGGTGLIGRALIPKLEENGHNIILLSRTEAVEGLDNQVFTWDIEKGELEEGALQDVDSIINLAGAGIADERWSDERKKVILESRVGGNDLIFKTLSKMQDHRVQQFIGASAIGIYGDRGEEVITEKADVGGEDEFLVRTCVLWEKSAKQMEELGLATSFVRTGLVLAREDGMLPRLLTPARLGVLPYFGDGKQFFSWIHIDDIADIYIWLLEHAGEKGAFNATAPNPVRNKEFVKTLLKVKSGPGITFPMPQFVLNIALGEMAESLIEGAKVIPERLEENSFKFQFATLSVAFKDLLGLTK